MIHDKYLTSRRKDEYTLALTLVRPASGMLPSMRFDLCEHARASLKTLLCLAGLQDDNDDELDLVEAPGVLQTFHPASTA